MLKLYRRHRKECEGGHAEDTRSGEFEEGRRGWKKCACLIHVSGTLAGKFSRKQIGSSDWEQAKGIAAGLEKAKSWDGKAEPVAAPPASPRVTIEQANKIFLENRKAKQLAYATLRKYVTFLKQIKAYCDGQGYVMLDQITPADVDVFYSNWKLGPRAKGKRLSTLRAFFRFCVNRKWIPETPVSVDIKPPLGANRVANKAPFTDAELQRIIDACDKLGDVEWFNGVEHGKWSGEDAKDFIWMMVYTGLRISDVGLFNMGRLKGNEIFLRAKKNGGDVFAYVPTWLRDRLVARAAKHGQKPFAVGRIDRLETVTELWRRKLNRVFALAGEFEEKATPHRFRHTFARILLERGIPVSDVAELLGDTEGVVATSYARWVPERQARLTRILQDAFEGKPKPKLVSIR